MKSKWDNGNVIDIETKQEKQRYINCKHYESRNDRCKLRGFKLKHLRHYNKSTCGKCKVYASRYKNKSVLGEFLNASMVKV